MVKRVAVIGVGAAGLCALRHLAAKPALYEPVGFEQLSSVGGTWNYTDRVGTDENGLPVQSSMYKNLRTNLPKEVMAYPGFPFPTDLPSFVKHEDMLKYFVDYCQFYKLEPLIKFGTHVNSVEALRSGSETKWRISYCKVADKTNTSDDMMFDAVMVCNGHYAVPSVPELSGMAEFQGTVIHSHDYREPEVFRDKVVVCLGAAASGQDIALDIATAAKQVIISHNKMPLQTHLPDKVQQQPGIKQLSANTVIFNNDVQKTVDVLMLCTGYKYSFPFLHGDCMLDIDNERVTPLYKHLIHSKYPSMAVIGLCKTICPCPLFEHQVQFFLSTLEKTFILPSREEMEKDIREDFEARLCEGLPVRYAHTMGPRQWAYNTMLAEMGKFTALPPVVQNLYDEVHTQRVTNLPNYKKYNYRITGIDSYEVIEP